MTVQTHRLANGFRIVTEAMPGLQSAAVGIWVAAGGRHEAEAQNGIAHFLEHMAFKGTARRNALQIAEAIEDVGGYINAYTSREVTAYYARVLGDDVPLAIDVIADILRNPTFEPDEIEVERGVILSEIGQALDTPDDVIFDWLQAEAYPDQPLGRTILGPAERVRAFGRDDLANFVGQHYGPGDLILSAAGAVDHDHIVQLAERLFGDMTPRPKTTVLPAAFSGGAVRMVKPLEQAHLAIGFESPHYTHADAYVAQIYASALGGSMSSRLFQEIRENRGLCYTIYAQAGAYSDSGMTTIYAGTGIGEIGQVAALSVDEMKRIADTLTSAELERARAQMKAGMLMGLEGPSSRAERQARMLQIWDRVPPLEDVTAKIDAVDMNAFRTYAEHMATSAPAALAIYGSEGDTPDLDDINERRAA